jgi:hypothetical protein
MKAKNVVGGQVWVIGDYLADFVTRANDWFFLRISGRNCVRAAVHDDRKKHCRWIREPVVIRGCC